MCFRTKSVKDDFNWSPDFVVNMAKWHSNAQYTKVHVKLPTNSVWNSRVPLHFQHKQTIGRKFWDGNHQGKCCLNVVLGQNGLFGLSLEVSNKSTCKLSEFFSGPTGLIIRTEVSDLLWIWNSRSGQSVQVVFLCRPRGGLRGRDDHPFKYWWKQQKNAPHKEGSWYTFL